MVVGLRVAAAHCHVVLDSLVGLTLMTCCYTSEPLLCCAFLWVGLVDDHEHLRVCHLWLAVIEFQVVAVGNFPAAAGNSAVAVGNSSVTHGD